MIFIFSTSEKVGARLIRWGLNTDVSHMAVLKENMGACDMSIVLEARMQDGVDITWLRTFKKKNKIVTALVPIRTGPISHDHMFHVMEKSVAGKSYDWKGIGYLALAAIYFVKILGKEIQNTNPWADKKDYYCSLVLHSVKDWLVSKNVDMGKYPSQMLTPDRAREILLESGSFKEIIL